MSCLLVLPVYGTVRVQATMRNLHDKRRFTGGGVALALALCLLAGRAAAEPAAGALVVLLPLRQSGVQQRQLLAVEHGLREVLRAQELRPAGPDMLSRARELVPASCTSQQCMDRIANLMDAQMVVGGRLQREGHGWTLQLWVYDRRGSSARDREVATAQRHCRACDESQIVQQSRQALHYLLGRRASSGSAHLVIRSRPDGAVVLIDGTAMGVTNMTLGVRPGRHTVTLQKQGYTLSVHEVDVEAGGRGAVEANLKARRGSTRRAGDTGRRSLDLGKWGLAAAAAAGLGAGITLLAVDGTGCESDRPSARCAEQWDTGAPGIALTIAGAAAAAGSAALFYWSARRRASDRRVALGPWCAPGAAGVTGTITY